MSTNKILLKFAKKGINLSPEAYNKVINAENPIDFASSLIVKLKSDKFTSKDLVSVSGEIVDEITGNPITEKDNQETLIENQTKQKTQQTPEKPIENQTPQVEKTPIKPIENQSKPKTEQTPQVEKPVSMENLKKDSDVKQKHVNEAILEASETVKDEKIKFKRNLEKSNVEYDFEIIQDTSKKSYTSGELENLISYFKSRYEKLYNILSKRPELRKPIKVADIDDSQDSLSMILMVKEIRSSKNGHKIVDFEDDTGSISVLFSNNNDELFAEAEKLVRDEVIGVIANKSDDNNFAFGQQIINPGVLRVPEKEMDFGIVFLSDVHIGSLTFLEDAFTRFIDWINCDYGTEEQRRVAEDVKYLIIGGDIVDGIGVYPNQEKELAIKDITEQYNEAARFLGNVRSDIKIIIAPGNHDASRVAEPQPAVPEEYAKALYELDNVEFISNPGVVSLDGINVLIYHGRSFDDLVMAVKEFTHERNDLLMEELLQKRHLAPIYGERTPLASELEDYLVIDEVPDVFHTGHVHINTYRRFKGIHMINSGTFQTQTEFQKIYNIEPTPAEVPVLHKGKYKHFKFLWWGFLMKKNIDEIIKISNEIYDKGLVSGKAGNISVRFKGEIGDIIAITPTLKSLSKLNEEDIVLVDLDGNVLTKGKPSSEVNMHLEIYKKRPDVNGIVHTHSPYATGFAHSSKKIKRYEGFGEIKTPYLAEIDYEKPGSDELAKSASEGLGTEDVLVLKNHGVICVSDNLKEAELLAVFVEEIAKSQFITLMLNSVEDRI